MRTEIWTCFGLILLAASLVAYVIAAAHEKRFHPLRGALERFGRLPLGKQLVVVVFVCAMWAYASVKPGDGGVGGGGGDGGRTNRAQTQMLKAEDFSRGFVLTRVGTNEVNDFSPPEGVSECADWRAFGAAEDWIYIAFTNWAFRIATNDVEHLRVFSFGKIEPLTLDADGNVDTNKWFAPFRASLGIVPQANWNLLAESGVPSRFWHDVTPSNTLVMTWQNVLLNRDAEAPLSFQVELWPGGRFVYRYDLSRLGAETVSDILVGASFGAGAWVTNAIQTNVTSLAFHPLTDADRMNLDRDRDGLTLFDELFAFYTDPDLRDTDGDGLSDGEEASLGTNPLVRDSDHDGLVDGSDPDPLNATSVVDEDADGIPDAYEIHWFGGTNATNTATNRDGTGFTLEMKILAGVNPTNAASAADVASANGLVSWKLFDGFALTTNSAFGTPNSALLWERTFAVNRTSAWQQYFVSADPTNAAPWALSGMVLEWETDTGAHGSAGASPCADSLRVPLAADDRPVALTLRLRATASVVHAPTPLHLIAYAPEFRMEGCREITGADGGRCAVFTGGAESGIGLVVDGALRPHRAPAGDDECDMAPFDDLAMQSGGCSFVGDVRGGMVFAPRPGVYDFPDLALDLPLPAARASTRRVQRRSPGGGGGGFRLLVLDPSAAWSCVRRYCYPVGLVYDWETGRYGETDSYPLDTACLRDKWRHDFSGNTEGECEFRVSSGLGDDCGGLVSVNGASVYVSGVVVWTGSDEHVHREFGSPCIDASPFQEGCGCGEDDGCEKGLCDSLEGASIGSLKFRIPLGAPVRGQVAGFVWFATE